MDEQFVVLDCFGDKRIVNLGTLLKKNLRFQMVENNLWCADCFGARVSSMDSCHNQGPSIGHINNNNKKKE